MTKSSTYWNSIGTDLKKISENGLRAYSDEVNKALINRWAPTNKEHILKTDLFDEACSCGLYPFLQEKAIQVTGIDVADEIVKKAQMKYPRLLGKVCDIRKLDLETNTFDLVISNSTLDHFDNKRDILTSLQEIWRVMKPGGELIISFDNIVNPMVFVRNFFPGQIFHRLGIVPYYVGETFTPKELQTALQKTKFQIIEIDAVMHFPRVLIPFLTKGYASERSHLRFLRTFLAWEKLTHLPTRFFTGYYTAAKAIKPKY